VSQIPIPEDRHFRPRLLGYDPQKSRPWLERTVYSAYVFAFWLIVIGTYAGVPALFGALGWDVGWGFVLMRTLQVVLLFLLSAVIALLLILLLRKYLGKVQERYGPMHYGPAGGIQTVFDALKLLAKEDFVPAAADVLTFRLAPAVTFVASFAMFAVIPFASGWVLADTNVGLIYLIAVSTLSAYGVLLGGVSSGNKWALIGALRAGAQMVSYEIPLALVFLTVAVWSGTLSLGGIVDAQLGLWNFLPLALPFALYVIASLAELKHIPFDFPEAESELIAGYNVEYSGMSFAFFFLAEFVELFLLPALIVVFFFGGWHGPLFGLEPGSLAAGALESLYFTVKTAVWVWIFLWIRATLPRYRDDQLMEFAWKAMIPLALIGLVLAAYLRLIWR